MSKEQIRQDLVSAVNALHAGFSGGYPLVIEYDNILIVDTQTQVNPFLQVEIKIVDMEQADMSDSPIHRVFGQLVIAAAVKEGKGVKAANLLLDYFYPRLQRKAFGVVRTYMADAAPEKKHLGWVYTPVLIPFRADLRYSV
jgi:hypothetical protein